MRSKFAQHLVDYAVSGLVVTGLLIAALALAAAPVLVQRTVGVPVAHLAATAP